MVERLRAYLGVPSSRVTPSTRVHLTSMRVVSFSMSSHFGPRRAQVVLLGGILCALFSVEDQHTKLDGVLTTFAFFLGAILSASAGWLGMMVATDGAVSASCGAFTPSVRLASIREGAGWSFCRV